MPGKVRRGNCYVTVEALYHLLGGKKAGWIPHTVNHEGAVHWYLVHRTWTKFGKYKFNHDFILDPTAKQFNTKPPYYSGRGRGFLTKKPSERARELMGKMLWQD